MSVNGKLRDLGSCNVGSIPAIPIIWLHRITGLVYGPFKAEVGVRVSLGSLIWRIRIKASLPDSQSGYGGFKSPIRHLFEIS